MSDDVVGALLERRAQIAGEIELAQLRLRSLIADLDSLDAAVRVFAPDLATETLKERRAPPQHQALRGAVKATILAVMREAEGPVTTLQIAVRLAADRRLSATDDRVRKLFIQRVGAALFHMARRGEVERGEKRGRFVSWRPTNGRA